MFDPLRPEDSLVARIESIWGLRPNVVAAGTGRAGVGMAVCPKCNGTTRRPCPENLLKYRMATFDAADKTLACDNCGGQTMSLSATGRTRIDPATGLGCLHTYVSRTTSRCYHEHTCTKCGDRYDIDSGD